MNGLWNVSDYVTAIH